MDKTGQTWSARSSSAARSALARSGLRTTSACQHSISMTYTLVISGIIGAALGDDLLDANQASRSDPPNDRAERPA